LIKGNECKVLELISILGSQPAGDWSHKPGGRLSLLSSRPAVTSPAAKHHRPLSGTGLCNV